MSGMAGLIRFDPRTNIQAELKQLLEGIRRIGPDGESSVAIGSFGMAFSRFTTVPTPGPAEQPLCLDRFVFTFDGRLDNREELHTNLALPIPVDAIDDANLAARAYLRWSDGCFARLTGDWVLAVWDRVARTLVLARDPMGIRRLFYRLNHEGVSWCSLVEALVETSGRDLILDRAYIVDYFLSRPPADSTTFRDIRALLPGHYLRVDGEAPHRQQRYWCLEDQGSAPLRTDDEYDEEFRSVLSTAVRRRMRSSSTVLAELSGGLDSSSIVCMADQIAAQHHLSRVKTISYFDPEEPSGDERAYFELIEKHREESGIHISLAQMRLRYAADELEPLPKEQFVATPGYFKKTLVWAEELHAIRQQWDVRVVLSGVGGDELLGGVQDEAPEIADLLMQGRFASLLPTSLAWGVKRRKPLLTLWREAAMLSASHYRPSLLRHSLRKKCPTWLLLKAHDVDPGLDGFTTWNQLRPSLVAMEWDRYCMAAQLTRSDPPLKGAVEKRYPLLDQSLYQFLARIPRQQIVSAQRRRRLMRRALTSIVPETVLTRKTKWFGSRSTIRSLRSIRIEAMLQERWLSDGVIVDLAGLRRSFEQARHGDGDESSHIVAAVALEQWLRASPRTLRIS